MLGRKGPYEHLSENLPVDVMPCSNGEYIPERPTAAQQRVMAMANEEAERVRRRLGMSRRQFVRSAAAYAVGLWAINETMGTVWGRYGAEANNTRTNAACDLEFINAQMNNAPGEFIFDIQSHHVDSGGSWRATNPAFHIFFAAIWGQAGGVQGNRDDYWLKGQPTDEGFVWTRGGREVDPMESLSRYHYLKELYLDSSTNMCVLSAVPSEASRNPLPQTEAAKTVDTVNGLAGSQRNVMHAFVMPNRGSFANNTNRVGQRPAFMTEELESMNNNAELYGPGGTNTLRGWKIYPAWGDIPNVSGWQLDDPTIGHGFLNHVQTVAGQYGVPSLVAIHKGFALPGFDQTAASPRDVGPAAKAFPGVNFVIYHSGYDSEAQGPYPGDAAVNSSNRGVDCFIKSLRENSWDASRFVAPGLSHGNVPNVWGEIGSTWRGVMGRPDQASHLLGKLVTHVGPRRICWGTDALWYGSPQPEIVALRNFNMTPAARELYNLPWGLDGDVDDPTRNALDANAYLAPHAAVPGWPVDGRSHPERTIRNGIFGRNAAVPYGIDPDAARNAISCDAVQQIRDSYIVNEGTPREGAPLASNTLIGARTPEELAKQRADQPWAP